MKRRRLSKYGVTFNNEWQASIKLCWTQQHAWEVCCGKSNSRSRQQAVARGWGVCLVRVTQTAVLD